ncbi:MAG TPA: ribonuclease H-like domain-containing protein [Thermomicrobiaceae bacterium]|nr:ribonuclease H-like domain-containing protein [Thermomicrobiaceae bacterium]
MRSLRERLAALQSSSAPFRQPSVGGVPIEHVEEGSDQVSDRGTVFVVEQFSSANQVLNLLQHRQLTTHPYLTTSATVAPHEILFLDTETTGLAGGTGTHAFLVGLGYFQDGRFVLRQLFMRGPADEAALLQLLRESLGRFRMLVTFNGRTFDWPLLETRFILHGYRERFTFDHFDLLHPARRLWKARLESCSLGNLEAALFSVRRDVDVPGFLIPQLYFDYLRDGDGRRLRPVFAHNREDILTMVRLTDLLLRAAAEPTAVLEYPEDRVGMALLLLARGQVLSGLEMLGEAVTDERLSVGLRRRAEVEFTRGLKRLGRTPEAVPLWLAMCDRSARRPSLDLYPFEELAKFYEHDARDLDAALRVVERAQFLLELRGGSAADHAALTHRLERLTRRRAARHRTPTGNGSRDPARVSAAGASWPI